MTNQRRIQAGKEKVSQKPITVTEGTEVVQQPPSTAKKSISTLIQQTISKPKK